MDQLQDLAGVGTTRGAFQVEARDDRGGKPCPRGL